MAMGMNLGVGKMSEATKYTYRRLSWSVDWHIGDDTIEKAQAVLTNFVFIDRYRNIRETGPSRPQTA